MKHLIIVTLLFSATSAIAAQPDPTPLVPTPPPSVPAQADPTRTIVLTGPLSTIHRVEQSIQRSPYLSGREATQAVELIEAELARQAQPPTPAAKAK